LAAEQTAVSANWFQGTADAVRRHMSHYNLEEEDDVLILSGDHLYKMDFNELLRFHRKRNADVTVSVVPVPENETSQLGIMHIDKHQQIIDFGFIPTRAYPGRRS